jgi:hypothetical protein
MAIVKTSSLSATPCNRLRAAGFQIDDADVSHLGQSARVSYGRTSA